MKLKILKDTYAIYKFSPDENIPLKMNNSDFYSITQTDDEISLVCRQSENIKDALQVNKDWRVLKIIGPLDLSLVGVIAEISKILSENSIPIFTISTFETDYILVKDFDLNKAAEALGKNKNIILEES